MVPIRSIISVVQVLDGDIARAVDYARSVGCRVISMSLGGRGFNGLQAAIARAVDEGVIVMAAAGNYVGFVSAPASYPECLAVAASTIDDQPWSGSSRGSEVDISAPGQAVWTAATNKGPNGPVYSIEQGDGTSFAVAALAGIAALWLAHHDPAAIAAKYGGRTQEMFRSLVAQTCRTPPGWDTSRYGAGIVDAKALLDAALPALPPAVPAAAVRRGRRATGDGAARRHLVRPIHRADRDVARQAAGWPFRRDRHRSAGPLRERDPLPGRGGPGAAPGAGASDGGRRRRSAGRRGGGGAGPVARLGD